MNPLQSGLAAIAAVIAIMAAVLHFGGPERAGRADTPEILARAAAGDITRHGGARRLGRDTGPAHAALAAHGADAPVRNVILMIGDGMGDSEITVARNYAEGAGGYFRGIDALPAVGHYTHYAIHRETGLPVYVTDSAASATAFASGVKTYNRAIGIDIHGAPHRSLLRLAQQAGLATGNVSTAAIQDATPAAQYAHAADRDCAGPQETALLCPESLREHGGAGSISEQLLDVRPDVTLGGGASAFRQMARAGRWQGRTLLEQATDRGFTVVADAAELESLRAGHEGPVLGLFSESHMPVRWSGPLARRYGNIEYPPVTCTPDPARPDTQPTLADMTRKAIELLEPAPRGFFLQVEGASIDKQAHDLNPCGQIGETVDLDEAVQAALDFAQGRDDTLVILTADHAHATQIISHDVRAPGQSLALLTRDGAVMAVTYGNVEGGAGHTGAQLRIAAYGPRAFNVAGLLDQTDIFFIIRDALGLEDARD